MDAWGSRKHSGHVFGGRHGAHGMARVDAETGLLSSSREFMLRDRERNGTPLNFIV